MLLKKVLLNGKKIPVPVPIQTLTEAVAWVERHLLRPDHMITRIQLDGKDLELGAPLPATSFGEDSDLRFKIDSPTEICVQTIDALRNLAGVISRNLKPIAVLLWELKGNRLPLEVTSVIEDVVLMNELFDHILVLVDKKVEVANAIDLQIKIRKAFAALQVAIQQTDFKGMARVLLNQLETPVNELSAELSSLEKSVFEVQADRHIERRNLGT